MDEPEEIPERCPAVRLDMEQALYHAHRHGLLVGLCERIWDATRGDPEGHREIRDMLREQFCVQGPPFS